jgi:glycerophosphoryl diester phosphodiesterase
MSLYTIYHMKIIAHRGASAIELENTKSSMLRAVNMQVPSIEIDTRLTRDNRLIVCHDSDTRRIAHKSVKIKSHTLAQLQKIPLLDGSRLLSLEQALKLINKQAHVIIELKDRNNSFALERAVKGYSPRHISFASFYLRELVVIKEHLPKYNVYGLEKTKPFDCIHLAKILKLDGVGLNFWLLNPLTYYLCKRASLKLYVYTVNHKFLLQLITKLYPTAAICTDHPEWHYDATTS